MIKLKRIMLVLAIGTSCVSPAFAAIDPNAGSESDRAQMTRAQEFMSRPVSVIQPGEMLEPSNPLAGCPLDRALAKVDRAIRESSGSQGGSAGAARITNQ